MLYTLATRDDLRSACIHDRNPLFVQPADGSIRNGYTVASLNKRRATRRFGLDVPGSTRAGRGRRRRRDAGKALDLEVGPDQTREVRVLVTTRRRRRRRLARR